MAGRKQAEDAVEMTGAAEADEPTSEAPANEPVPEPETLVVRRTPGWFPCRIKGRVIAGGALAPEISIAEAETRPDFEVVPLSEIDKGNPPPAA